MKYDLLTWLHAATDTDPSLLLYEYNEEGSVPRMLEVFLSGDVVLKIPDDGQRSVVHGDYPHDDLEENPTMLRFEIEQTAFEKVLGMVTRTQKV